LEILVFTGPPCSGTGMLRGIGYTEVTVTVYLQAVHSGKEAAQPWMGTDGKCHVQGTLVLSWGNP
jgi:hypothetical protein